MRSRILLCWLLLVFSQRLVAAVPQIDGLLTGYANLATPVTIRSVHWGPGVPYGPAGTPITIIGTSFGASGTVNFAAPPSGTGTVAASVVSWGDSGIVVTVPSGAVTGNVTVTVGGLTSNPMPFIVTTGTYNASCSTGGNGPVINSLWPNSGPVGTLTGVDGLHFGSLQGSSTLYVNGVAAFIMYWSDTSIAFVVPQGVATGPVRVVVSGTSSNSVNFNVVPTSCPTSRLLRPPLLNLSSLEREL